MAVKSKRCSPFRHVWSRDVFISFAYEAMILKVCLNCQKVKPSKYHISGYHHLGPDKLENAIQQAMKLEGIPYSRENVSETQTR